MADIETINFVEERYRKTASHYANKYNLNTNLNISVVKLLLNI